LESTKKKQYSFSSFELSYFRVFVIGAFSFRCFSFKEVDNGGSDDLSDVICQGIHRTASRVVFVRVEAVVQCSAYIRKAQAFLLEPFDFLDDKEMLKGVAALAAFGAKGHNDVAQLSFPETEGVFGDAGAFAHFLDGQCFD
jgi:hypothetical protein